MKDILFHYVPVHPVTWAYLSSLLMIGLFFKFSRFWNVRNFDLVLLILLAPGLLLAVSGHEIQAPITLQLAKLKAASLESAAENLLLSAEEPTIDEAPAGESLAEGEALSEMQVAEAELQRGRSIERLGFIWLYAVGLLLLFRLLIDPAMVRRPLLEPNLSTGGLVFIGCSMFVFLMANVITSRPTEDDLRGPRGAKELLARQLADENDTSLARYGPGLWVIHVLPSLPTLTLGEPSPTPALSAEPVENERNGYAITAKTMAILAHLAVVVGLIGIGYRHFDNLKMGMGCAVLYLMLPYTAQMTGRVSHVLPAALLVWAVFCYRRPLTSGIFMGLAIGVVYYPIFLLPLWLSFYWQRGLTRFAVGVLSMLIMLSLSLIFVSSDWASFWALFQKMFGLWAPRVEHLEGIWRLGWDPVFRIPILTAFVALSGGLAIWPPQKNLGTLISCSAAVMVATQFWHGDGGGLFIAWYLPLLLLTIIRPNLEDRVALSVLGEGWLPRRRQFAQRSIDQAA